jgi:SAM-dependent methyltransferase
MPNFYEDYWSKRLDEVQRGIDFNEQRHFHLKWPKLHRYIPKGDGVVIVDFGCGDGRIIKEMQVLNPNARFIGLDVSETALARASAFLPAAEFYKVIDGGAFPLADSSVDFLITSEVIEHVYDTRKAFSEISRVLTLGGRLLLTTPYHGFVKNLLILLLNHFDKHFDPTGPHIRFFSKKSLISCLTKVGLKDKKHGYFGRFYPISHCIYVLAEKN